MCAQRLSSSLLLQMSGSLNLRVIVAVGCWEIKKHVLLLKMSKIRFGCTAHEEVGISSRMISLWDGSRGLSDGKI